MIALPKSKLDTRRVIYQFYNDYLYDKKKRNKQHLNILLASTTTPIVGRVLSRYTMQLTDNNLKTISKINKSTRLLELYLQ